MKTGTWHFSEKLETRQDVDAAVLWLKELLEDFPDPVCTWLDERSDDCEHGPHCWSPEIQNDQTTYFTFNVSKLGPALGISLLNACSTIIHNDEWSGIDYGPSSAGSIMCSRVFTLTVVFAQNSIRQPYHVSFAVSWDLDEDDKEVTRGR